MALNVNFFTKKVNFLENPNVHIDTIDLLIIGSKMGQRNRIRNGSKCSTFRRWLIDSYGWGLLRSGSGILDIAGGKGELAFELGNGFLSKSSLH